MAPHTDILAFHECSISSYAFAQHLSRAALLELAERVPNGPSTQELISIARSTSLTILAGLFGKETDPHSGTEKIYNTYLCISGDGLLAKHRKLHPFISQHLSTGAAYTGFETHGWRAGILICYDNNVVESARDRTARRRRPLRPARLYVHAVAAARGWLCRARAADEPLA
jgi:predicted amidohydrolase